MIYKPSGSLVAPSLCSGRYSPGALGFLNRVDPSVSVSNYYLGRKFLIESDHKPLIPLLNTKQLDSMPPRILYDYLVCHVPGKHLYTADTLSRAPVAGDEDDSLQKEVEVFVDAVVERPLPATEQCLNTYRCAHKQDPLCQQVIEHC